MNGKIALYAFIIIISILSIMLNGWAYLLQREPRFLIQVVLSFLFIIGAVINLRRELQARQPR